MSNKTNDDIQERIAEEYGNKTSSQLYDLLPKLQQNWVMEICGNDKDKFDDAVDKVFMDYKVNELAEA